MNVLQSLGLALVAMIFVHFKNDATGEPVYLKDPITGEDDKSKPVGVNMVTPGSKDYKAAQSVLLQRAIDEKNKKVTARKIEANGVELLAMTTTAFVNFDYNGPDDAQLAAGASQLDRSRAFYLDPMYANLRAQVEEKMGDTGAFLAKPSSV
jgi:hypothetical protein